MMKKIPNIESIRSYFDQRVQTHGTSAQGSDWNSVESQYLRFDQLVKVIEPDKPFSILDYGSGSGAFVDYLNEHGFHFDYYGYDILESAISLAQNKFKAFENCHFTNDERSLIPCDYVIASGIFNYRGDQSYEDWTDYVLETLSRMHDLSVKGFSSNFLTKYSDEEKMRPDLYYADPLFLFDYCKKHYSKNVALLHDYKLYDFTIIIRKAQ